MKKLAWKLSSLENLVIDFCAGICCTLKECMLLDQHKKFVRFDLDSELQSAAKADLVLTFVFQVLSPKCDISGGVELIAATKGLYRRENCSFGAQEGQCVGCSVRVGCYTSVAEPSTELHLNDIR